MIVAAAPVVASVTAAATSARGSVGVRPNNIAFAALDATVASRPARLGSKRRGSKRRFDDGDARGWRIKMLAVERQDGLGLCLTCAFAEHGVVNSSTGHRPLDEIAEQTHVGLAGERNTVHPACRLDEVGLS